MKKTIGIFVGSLRKDSYNLKIAKFITTLESQSLEYQLLEIGNLPLYNQDFDGEGECPESYSTFRDKVKALDGFLYLTPEYNRSIPAVLKNALDVGSRPWGESVWEGKPGAVISLSVGPTGGFGANHHLRQVLTSLGVLTLQKPEAYLNGVSDADFDEKGGLINKHTADFVAAFVASFEDWVNRLS